MPPLYEPLGPGYGRYTFADGSHDLMTEDDARTFQAQAQQVNDAADPQPLAGDPSMPPVESPNGDGSPVPNVALGLPPSPDDLPPPGSSPPSAGIVDPFAAPQVPGALAPLADAAGGAVAGAGNAIAGAAGDLAAPGPAPAPAPIAPTPEQLPGDPARPAMLPTAQPDEIKNATRDDVYADRVHSYDLDAKAKADDALIKSQGELDKKAVRDQAIADAAKVAQDAEAQRVATEAKIKATADQYDTAVKDFINTKVDRPRLSLGDILGTILAGAGAVANRDSGPNPAMLIAERQIQQIVDDQYKRKASMKEGIDLLGGQLTDQKKDLRDVLGNRDLLTAALWQDASHRIDSISDRVTSAGDSASLQQFAADAANKAAEAKADGVEKKMAEDKAREMQQAALHQQNVDSRRSAWVSRANNRDDIAARERMAKDAAQARIDAAKAKGASKEDLQRIGRQLADYPVGKNPDGSPIFYEAATNKAWEEVSNKLPAAKEMVTILDQMQGLRDAHKALSFTNFLGTPEGIQWHSLVGQLGANFKQYAQLGAWDNGVEKLVGKIGGNLNDADAVTGALAQELWKSGPGPGLKTLRDGIVRNTNRVMESKRRAGTSFAAWAPVSTADAPDHAITPADELVDKVTKAKSPDEMRDAAKPNSLLKGWGTVAGALTGSGRVRTDKELRADASAADALDVPAVQAGGFNVSTDQADAIRGLGKMAQAKDANAIKSLEGLAGNMARPDVAAYALDALVKSGAPADAIERVRVARSQGLKRSTDQQTSSDIVDAAVGRAQPASPADAARSLGQQAAAGDVVALGSLGQQAIAGDAAARAELGRIAQSGGGPAYAAQRWIDRLKAAPMVAGSLHPGLAGSGGGR